MTHFADRLIAAIGAKNAPICVGLDPVAEKLPRVMGPATPKAALSHMEEFCRGVIRVTAPHVPAVKIQSACFERYGWEGVRVCDMLIQVAQTAGLIVILDAKRGDIGASSEHYAAGLLAAPGSADALTVNSYLGADGLEPFIQVAAQKGKGLFTLVRTSNPGGDALQSLTLADGGTVSDAVAKIMAHAGAAHIGQRGYSLLGAVVGATKPADALRLRQLMPQQIFLVPGFGAQGGKADDVQACFNADGTGALITASRSVLYPPDLHDSPNWQKAVERATLEMKQQVAAVLKSI